MKRAYKLQEFVAHTSRVNCLKIGRKTSRVLVTGGEDQRVNMWAVGKPNAILSLAGHSSPVESVTFDAAESHVVAGAASGAIKLWDLEEAKIVRTLAGHRSSCKAVDFHPFGEFFASASADNSLKIWDIRRKGCIHTYKGHSRGVNCLKFSPDGRWVVSGGEDNIVKLWDLTAGKLIHDFKFHEDQVLSLDFHPHEFLLATGSNDRTSKLYDLETFELIGSSGPEASGIRSMMFTPDGRTLLTGMQDNMKVYTWEPLRCHDTIDAGWPQLADMNVQEGKVIGCSLNDCCVGVWVVDLTRVAPFRSSSTPAREVKSPVSNGEHLALENVKTPSPKREGVASPPRRLNTEPSTNERQIVSPTADTSDVKPSVKHHSHKKEREEQVTSPVRDRDRTEHNPASGKHHSLKKEAKEELVHSPPVRDRTEQNIASHKHHSPKKESREKEHQQQELPSSAVRDRIEQNLVDSLGDKNHRGEKDLLSTSRRFRREAAELLVRVGEDDDPPRSMTSLGASTTGYTRPWSANVLEWDNGREKVELPLNNSDSSPPKRGGKSFFVEFDNNAVKRSRASEDDLRVIEEILQERNNMTTTMQSRLAKLQVVRRFWMKNDVKSAVDTMSKVADKSVLVDGLSVLVERSDVFTLEIAAMLLPLLNDLLTSETKRHVLVAIAFTGMLVRNFGPVISDTVCTCPTLGVDLQAERRFERCEACFRQLRIFKMGLKPFLSRRSGELGKAASNMTLVLERMKV